MKEDLSPRQIELLTLASQGLCAKEIARVVGIKPETVKVHFGRIRLWLRARNIAHAVSIAMTRGYIPKLEEASC